VADEYQWISFKHVHDSAEALSLGLREKDLAPEVEAEGKMSRFMGICSNNRDEWVITMFAHIFQGMVSVPILERTTEDSTKYIVEDTGLTSIVCSEDQAKKFIKMKL